MAFSPDGRLLAVVSWTEGRITVWDATTGKEVAAWRAHDGFANGLAFAPGGRVLATTGSDRAVRLWDVATGRQLTELTHDGAYALAFSPDGAALTTTGTRDRQVKVWDVSGVPRAPAPP
jgi:WD40 repeat protein